MRILTLVQAANVIISEGGSDMVVQVFDPACGDFVDAECLAFAEGENAVRLVPASIKNSLDAGEESHEG